MWRIIFVILSGFSVLKINDYKLVWPHLIALGVVIAILAAVEMVVFRKLAPKTIIATATGAIVGGLGYLITSFFADKVGAKLFDENTSEIVHALLFFGCEYLALSMAYRVFPKLTGLTLKRRTQGADSKENPKILDTSVVVDGRILDIAETGFIDGVFIVPEFVLKEIQLISDSRDGQKRIRGRRALDILNKMKMSDTMPVSIIDRDFPEVKEVDLKLLELAKEMHAKVITNDYNLNKVAAIHDVEVLNINDLSKSLTPSVMPNDILNIEVISEGQERNQAVGHLEDGTMIVIENAKHLIGKKADVKVVRLHQTGAGRIIFAELDTSRKNGIFGKNKNDTKRRPRR